MIGRTRRVVLACALITALMVPVEAALMAAMRTPDAAAAAKAWAASQSPQDIDNIARHIQDYTFFYRRAIMAALEPDARSIVWRRYLASYIESHPEIDTAGRTLIQRAAATMTPEVFDDNPPPARVAALAAIFETAVPLFGRRTANDLFIRLGPEVTSDQALPWSMRVTNIVRNWMSVSASTADCECSSLFATSCDVIGAAGDTCTEAIGCDPIGQWPMCGVAWAAPCNGVCATVSRPKR